MTIKEQLIGIIKAAPYLVRQSTTLLVCIIAIPFLLHESWQTYRMDWKPIKAQLVSFSKIQERIKDKKPDFFFVLQYEYKANNVSYYHSEGESYLTREKSEARIRFLKSADREISIWYDSNNPSISKSTHPTSDWKMYLFMVLILMGWIWYLKWLLLKYYVLEIKG